MRVFLLVSIFLIGKLISELLKRAKIAEDVYCPILTYLQSQIFKVA